MKKFKTLGKLTSYIAILSLLIQSLAGVAPVFADDTGFLPPSAVVSNTGWTNPSAVYTSNNVRATANDTDDIAQYGSFNFNVPDGATVEGVEVRVEGYRTGLLIDRQANITLSGDMGTTWSSSKTTNLPYSLTGGSESTRDYGSSTDLWGKTSWGYSEFSNDNFRLKLDATTALWDLKIDYLAAKVYYTPNTAPTVPVLTAPTDGTLTNDNTPYLKWNASTDTEGNSLNYGFEISTASDFSSTALTGGTAGTAFQVADANALLDGTYYWRIRANDGFVSSEWSNVWSFTIDTIAPVITILSDNPATITYGDTYTDGGATALDNGVDDLTSSILATSDVDNMAAGNYTVSYDVTDAAGNAAITVTRDVVVAKKKIKVTANNVSKFVGSVDPALTYSYTGTLVGTDAFSCSVARVAGETPNSYLIDQGTLALNDNYEMEFATGVFTISAIPVVPTFTTPAGAGDGEVLGVKTTDDTQKDTDVKGTSDTKKDDEKTDPGFLMSTWLGIHNWFWLLLAAAAISGGMWWLLGYRRRRDEE